MREALIILLVIAVLLCLTAFRYRRQILTVHKIWKMLRSARQFPSTETENDREPFIESGSNGGQLVNCSKCGDWVPEASAIKLGRAYFCTTACFEKTARSS